DAAGRGGGALTQPRPPVSVWRKWGWSPPKPPAMANDSYRDRRGGSPCVTRRKAGFCCLPVHARSGGGKRGGEGRETGGGWGGREGGWGAVGDPPQGGFLLSAGPRAERRAKRRGEGMTSVWALAALWLSLALIAGLLSIWLRISTALSEIVVGTVAQLIFGAVIGSAVLGTDESWIKFLSGIGAIVLTFLAGAELDPAVFKLKWKEAVAVGLASFFFPFLGCAAGAHYVLGWEVMPSWLAGVAMSTTSVAVVYAVMLEFGFNTTEYGKTVLAACFVTDLGTVVALGLIFAPFTLKTVIFVAASIAAFVVLPWLTPRFFHRYGNRPSELEAKYLLLCLLGLGALATW